jgi:hypothetical protein
MTTRKSSTGKTGAKKLKVKKHTLKDLGPKGGKKVAGGRPVCSYGGGATRGCTDPTRNNLCTAFTYCGACDTAMTQCKQITCA